MFKGLRVMNELKAKGIKIENCTYKTSVVIDGVVEVDNEQITVGGYALNDFVNEFVTCYGKEVKIKIDVEVIL